VEKVENILSMKLKSKSLRRERSPHAEGTVSTVHSSDSSVTYTRRF
jgi:hypothetical protein